jgi:hypothetical protein
MSQVRVLYCPPNIKDPFGGLLYLVLCIGRYPSYNICMGTGLRFWYFVSPAWFLKAAQGSVGSFDSVFALKATLLNITKPVFQDYTREGRIIGFFFRLGRILFASFLYLLIWLFWLVLFIAWILLPLLAVANILRLLT